MQLPKALTIRLRRRGWRRLSSGSMNGSADTASPKLSRRTSNAGAAAEAENRFKSFRVRTISTIVLIGTFIGIIAAGHVPLMFMILGIQFLMVREVFALARVRQQEKKVPGFRAQQWYFFFVAAFYLYIRFIKKNLTIELTSSARTAAMFGWLLRHHTIMSFSLYTAGFVLFVLTLKKGMYTYQFGQYAWTHMILMTIFFPSSFFVSNIFEGLIWFLLPAALVIINDIAAYLAGFFFGRTPLIQLSPKKTWEGFVGGLIGTTVASWYMAGFLSRFDWFVCPRTDLSIIQPLDCAATPSIYSPQTFYLTDILTLLPAEASDALMTLFDRLDPGWQALARGASLTCLPMQLHAVVLATFASLIAPFGGFFASGFKRGFKIKDFGDSIPGHGGMTDRMDCQVVMAVFSYVYFTSYVAPTGPSVGSVLSAAVRLTPLEQLDLFSRMANVLVGAKVLPSAIGETIATHARRRLPPAQST
ncbi:PCT1 [Auxenochlorella protothecoides x Auxenochlorella symbiontica]